MSAHRAWPRQGVQSTASLSPLGIDSSRPWWPAAGSGSTPTVSRPQPPSRTCAARSSVNADRVESRNRAEPSGCLHAPWPLTAWVTSRRASRAAGLRGVRGRLLPGRTVVCLRGRRGPAALRRERRAAAERDGTVPGRYARSRRRHGLLPPLARPMVRRAEGDAVGAAGRGLVQRGFVQRWPGPVQRFRRCPVRRAGDGRGRGRRRGHGRGEGAGAPACPVGRGPVRSRRPGRTRAPRRQWGTPAGPDRGWPGGSWLSSSAIRSAIRRFVGRGSSRRRSAPATPARQRPYIATTQVAGARPRTGRGSARRTRPDTPARAGSATGPRFRPFPGGIPATARAGRPWGRTVRRRCAGRRSRR